MEEDISGYSQAHGPRIIKKHKESDFTNPNSAWFKLTLFFGGLATYPTWILVNNSLPQTKQFELVGLTLVGVRFWLKYCEMDPKKADRSWTKFWFWVDEKLHRHTYNRITTGESRIERLLGRKLSVVYPVVAIHPGGLVQFDDNQYVVYADLQPGRPSDEDRKLHRMFMKGVVDGMYENQIIKIISSSKKQPRKQVIEYLTKLASKAGSKERAEHLNSLLRAAISDTTQAKMARQYAMIGIGRHDTLEAAIVAKNSMVEGMLLNLKRAKQRPKLLTNKRQIEKLLREATSEVAVI